MTSGWPRSSSPAPAPSLNDPPAKDRTGYLLETPDRTFPALAVNGSLTEAELHELVDSLVPRQIELIARASLSSIRRPDRPRSGLLDAASVGRLCPDDFASSYPRNTMLQMEIDDERQVVGGVAGQARVDDPGVADLERTAYERLVERDDRPVGRERAEPGPRRRDLHEAMSANGPLASVLSQSLKSPTISVGRCADSRKRACSSRCRTCQCRSRSARPRCQCTR